MSTQSDYASFDTTVGCTYFNVDTASLPEEVSARLIEANRRRKKSAEAREEFALMLMGIVSIGDYSLMAHEYAHSLQAITHPSLYMRCLSEMSQMMTVIDGLRKSDDPLRVPLEGDLSWSGVLQAQLESVRIEIGPDEPRVERIDGTSMDSGLSAGDLLEDSASIFQYRAEIGSAGTAKSYRRWREERRYRYANTFDFLEGVLGPEEAYVALPAMVLAAYDTLSPLRAFIALVDWTANERRGLIRELGADEYLAVLERLQEANLGVFGGAAPPQGLSAGGQNARLGREQLLQAARMVPSHPLSPVVTLAWKDEENARRLREAILHPYRAFNRNDRDVEKWLEPYQPPARAFRSVGGGFGLGDMALAISPTVAQADSGLPGGWATHILNLIRYKAFVFSAATPFARSRSHNCPHRSCPLHRFDMCRTWINIPARYEECEFPGWLEQLMNRRLDMDSEMLVKTTATRGVK